MDENNYKVITLIQAMSKESLKNARKFLRSPLHCTNASLLKLFDYLVERRERTFNKDAAYLAVHPRKKPNDRAIIRLMSLLAKQLEAFLAWEVFESRQVDQRFYLLEALQAYRLDKFFFQHWEQLRQELHDETTHANYGEKFQLARLHFFHPATDKYDLEGSQYLPMMQFLELDTTLKALRYSGEWWLYNRVLHMDAIPPLLTELVKRTATTDKASFPVVVIFSGLIELFGQPQNRKLFSVLFEILREKVSYLNWEDGALALKLLINFAGPPATQGDEFYQKQLFELMQWGLKTGLLLERGRVSDIRFTNVVVVAAKRKAFSWARKFVRDYSDHLIAEQEDQLDGIIALNEAYLYYHEGISTPPQVHLIQKAHECLKEVPKNRTTTGLRIYSLHLRILFDLYLLTKEADHFFKLEGVGRNFRSFLFRHEYISEEKKDDYRKFISYALQFGRWHIGAKKSVEQIRQWGEDLDAENVIMKDWLRRKWEEVQFM